ncbi:hypothetical protein [Chryseobacterium shigense]|uniref:Uncharacterized protein n=1 Tax=Chryseobacterium shigense TaxID=297244 RepID=A0A841N9R1_9FLAO|nr:hypothetical protein [Chryseobacterium shigense]MBB6370328.1 hypothetical protein [Chryseobacterium shigense]
MNSIVGGTAVITASNPGYNPPVNSTLLLGPIDRIPYIYTMPWNGLPNNGWVEPK